MTYLKKILTLQDRHIEELIDPHRGAIVVQIEKIHVSWLTEQALLLKKRSRKSQSKTNHAPYRYLCLDQLSREKQYPWQFLSSDIAYSLNTDLKAFRLDEQIYFDDLCLTYYQKTEQAVAPHYDVNCKNLVVTVTLRGSVPLHICLPNGKVTEFSCESSVGYVSVMRAARFLERPRPKHCVGRISDDSAITFGMRQYINKPEK